VRGRQFERLCRWYLQNAPEYRPRLRNVWLWKEWPGRWGPDAGIDLVAETAEGKLWAVQAKAYDPGHSISKPEVDSFLSESNRPEFAFRLLIATTDGMSANARRTLVSQEKRVGLVLRSHLEAADVEWPHDLESLAPSKRLPLSRFLHQQEAIEDVLTGFDSADRGQLIMACGTGKTLVALWVAEDLGSQRTLVLMPSLTLLSQTLREWTANASQPFDYLAVCSDETVAEHDAMVSRTADLGLPVTTEPAAIESFLKREGRRVIFATYQSSPRLAEASAHGAPGFDLAIADEAHRCTGPTTSDFTTILHSDQIRSRRRLFMTATPRYFSDRIKKLAGEAEFEVASMDDEEKFGPVLHRLTFGDAIERDLLSDYLVLVVGVDEDTYQRHVEQRELVTPDGNRVTDARTLASHVGLAKAMRGYDLRRTISFHGRVKKAQAFSSTFPIVIDWMPADERPGGQLWSKYVSGEMPTVRRNVLLGQFRNLEQGTRGLLSNARCLAEGIDVPAIDGVAFIDPRGSTIDIVQAVGRAIRKSPDKRVGVIAMPVFVSDDQDAEMVLEDSSFKPVWAVLKALRAHDEVLAEELDALRRRLGKEQGVTVARPGKIKFDVPAKVGEEFARAFDVRLVEQTTASWEFWFGVLQRFVEREGHARVPANHVEERFKLGGWVMNRRTNYREGALDAERKRRLEALPGWTWDTLVAQWEEGFARLKQFIQREGHARVPAHHVEGGLHLGSWVSHQRGAEKAGQLDPGRKQRLDALPGWVWDSPDTSWEEGFARLMQFFEREGHARVPKDYVDDGFKLGRWVSARRYDDTRGRLDPHRKRRLESLPGWVWNTLDASWEDGFTRLTQFVEREGHARVPQGHVENGFKLGTWVSTNREALRKGKLAPDRQRRLRTLPGWVWDAREAAVHGPSE